MQHNRNDDFGATPSYGVKNKQMIYLTQIRRTQLAKELRSRRADMYIGEEEVKETLQNRFKLIFERLLRGYKNAEEFKMQTDEMRELLESVSDTYYFNKILEESRFLENLIENLKEVYSNKLYLVPEYEDSIEVSLWFFCNALKYNVGFPMICDEENFNMIFTIGMEVVNARCLSTFANLLSNFIIYVANEGLAHKLIEISKKYYSKVVDRFKLAMSEIVTFDEDSKHLIDGAIFFMKISKDHLNTKFVKPEVKL